MSTASSKAARSTGLSFVPSVYLPLVNIGASGDGVLKVCARLRAIGVIDSDDSPNPKGPYTNKRSVGIHVCVELSVIG